VQTLADRDARGRVMVAWTLDNGFHFPAFCSFSPQARNQHVFCNPKLI
jgi:hypothetical protein